MYDGKLYQEKLSNFSLWPLYLVINDLPPEKCFSKDNIIQAGPWFGYSKPAMWIYLKPFHSSLRELEKSKQQLKVQINQAQLMCMRYFFVGHMIFLQKLACVTLCNLMVHLVVLNACNLAVQ